MHLKPPGIWQRSQTFQQYDTACYMGTTSWGNTSWMKSKKRFMKLVYILNIGRNIHIFLIDNYYFLKFIS